MQSVAGALGAPRPAREPILLEACPLGGAGPLLHQRGELERPQRRAVVRQPRLVELAHPCRPERLALFAVVTRRASRAASRPFGQGGKAENDKLIGAGVVLHPLHQPSGQVVLVPAGERHEDACILTLARAEGCRVPAPNALAVRRAVGFVGVADGVVEDTQRHAVARNLAACAGGTVAALVADHVKQLLRAPLALLILAADAMQADVAVDLGVLRAVDDVLHVAAHLVGQAGGVACPDHAPIGVLAQCVGGEAP